MTGAPLLTLAAIATTAAQPATPPWVEAALFYLFAGVTAAAAVGVVASRNIVRTAVALLFALSGVAGLFVLLHAEFLAAVQLVVYVGGTLILIVFGVMLTSKSPFSRFHPTGRETAVAVAVAAVLVTTLVLARPTQPPPGGARPFDPAAAADPTADLGLALLGDYLLPFELASVLLLAVMIGAAYLARGRRQAFDDAIAPPSAATARAMREDS
jgi:NADH:ubiquinone oxidoreductase subunit 6 (subunit J)